MAFAMWCNDVSRWNEESFNCVPEAHVADVLLDALALQIAVDEALTLLKCRDVGTLDLAVDGSTVRLSGYFRSFDEKRETYSALRRQAGVRVVLDARHYNPFI